MTAKTAIVTGANAGIGFELTRALASQGYTTVMACRNQTKAEAARQQLLEQQPDAKLIILPLDLSEPEAIENFIRLFKQQVGELDLLINNGGVMLPTLQRNSIGHEMQWATNYLGNFALTGKLLPLFRKDQSCRIVNVGSLSNRFGKLELDDLNWEKTAYTQMKGYSRGKVALMTFTIELNRRLTEAKSNIIALAAHPGFANTEITRKGAASKQKNAISQWIEDRIEPFVPVAADAARPILHAACASDVSGGDYYGPGGFMEIAGASTKKAKINPVALKLENGQRVWELSESMTGVHYLN